MWQYRGFQFPQDLWILIRVVYLTFFYTLLLNRKSFQQVLERLPQGCQKTNAEHAVDQQDYIMLDKIWRGTSFVLCHILRTDKPCLRRTLVLYHWFCSSNHNIKASVGVCKENNMLRSHAWLIINGVPFRENHAELEKYSPIIEW